VDKLLKNVIYYGAGILGSKLVFFLIVPLYSFFLSKEELGQYDLILISITLITPIITIQVSEGVYRFLLQHKNNSLEKQKIISSGFVSLIGGYFVFLVLATIINSFIDYIYFYEVILLQFTYSLYIYVQQIVRGLQKQKLFAYTGIINTCLVVLFSISSLYFYQLGFKGILLSLSAAQIISTITTIFYSQKDFAIKLNLADRQTINNMLSYAWPLLPNTISWWLIDLGNRYIILFYLGFEANGIYAVSARYAGIIALINSILILNWQDYAIQKKGTPEEINTLFSKIFNVFAVFQLSLLLFLTAISTEIIELTTASEFHEAQSYLPILFLSTAFSSFCAFYGGMYLKEKKTKEIFLTTIFGAALNLIISILLVDSIGLYAVAIGSVFGFFATFIVRSQTFRLKINISELCFLLFAFVVVFFGIKTDSFLQKTIIATISFAIFVFWNLRSLKKNSLI
tara:strand:+ start:1601 stop:2968 length:1368 start_codon:yes stop_codon:yes gene_type:complete